MWKRNGSYVICTDKLPADVLASVPHKAETVRGFSVSFFPDSYETARCLRSAGYKYPSWEETYTYAGPHLPMSHQRSTVQFLLDNDRAYVANGLGTGKTLSALWAADCLMSIGQVRRVLIVAPISAMWNAWATTIPAHFPNRRFKVLTGSARKKIETCEDLTYKILLVNPESLHIIADHLPMVDLVIADEATKFKTWKARRTKSLYTIAKERRIWMMSATPAPQSPTDAYAQIRIMRNGRYVSYTMFQDMTMLKRGPFLWVPRYNAMDIVAKELQPCIRFSREDCIDLPGLTVIDHKVALSDEQAKAIKSLHDKAVAMIGEERITAVNAAVVTNKILQVQSGAVYGEKDEDGNRATISVKADSVMESILDIVESNEHPVIVYARFRSTVAAVVKYLSANGIAVEGITADVTGKSRQEIFDRLQRGELKAIVAVASTISHGVTLTAADTIIWTTPEVSFETYDQANGRIYRKGQTKKCVIYRLYYDDFSRALLKRLDKKTSLQDCLVGLLQNKTVDSLG